MERVRGGEGRERTKGEGNEGGRGEEGKSESVKKEGEWRVKGRRNGKGSSLTEG